MVVGDGIDQPFVYPYVAADAAVHVVQRALFKGDISLLIRAEARPWYRCASAPDSRLHQPPNSGISRFVSLSALGFLRSQATTGAILRQGPDTGNEGVGSAIGEARTQMRDEIDLPSAHLPRQ